LISGSHGITLAFHLLNLNKVSIVYARFGLLKYNRTNPFLLSANFKQHSYMHLVFSD